MSKLKQNFKQHISLTSHRDIAELCLPLFIKYNFCIMNFIRLYNDGRVFYLCDNHDWLKHYFKHNYPGIGAFEHNLDFGQQEYVLWSALQDSDPIVTDSREIFNIRHGITIAKTFKDGRDFFNFGLTTNNPGIQDKLVNKINQLQEFINEFYQKANCLINKSAKHAFCLNDFKPKLTTDTHSSAPKKFFLGPMHDYQYLTIREQDCLHWLVKGYSVPDIAKALNLSDRTVEKHLENIKKKLNCTTQCQLGYLAAKLGIIQT